MKEKPANFNINEAKDDLYNWNSLRSQYLAEANNQIAGQYVDGSGFYPGWYWDPYACGTTPSSAIDPFYSPFGWGFYPLRGVGMRWLVRGRLLRPHEHIEWATRSPSSSRGGFHGGAGFHAGAGVAGGFHGGGFHGGWVAASMGAVEVTGKLPALQNPASRSRAESHIPGKTALFLAVRI